MGWGLDGPELPLTHPPPSLGVLDTILLGFLFVCLFTYLWPHQAMCGILVPQPGIKPGSPALGFPGSSAGKESACSAGDPGSIPGSGRSPGEGIGYPVFLGFTGGSDGKESTWNVGDLDSIPGLGRCRPGGGHGKPLSILAWRIPWTE